MEGLAWKLGVYSSPDLLPPVEGPQRPTWPWGPPPRHWPMAWVAPPASLSAVPALGPGTASHHGPTALPWELPAQPACPAENLKVTPVVQGTS